jgi:voltage-gated potassium channel
LKEELRKIIKTTDTPLAKAWDIIIQVLILLSLFLYSLETVPEMIVYKKWFSISEGVIVGVFTIEYVLRIYIAEKKAKFIFSFYGLIDLIAILPYFLSMGLADFRILRSFRLLRIFSILKLSRFSSATTRLKEAFYEIKNELIIFVFLTCIVLFISSAGIYQFEKDAQPEHFRSIFHSLWWSVVTLSTVGYGDVYPITVGGKIFTFFIIIAGLGIVSIPSGLLASSLSKTIKRDAEKECRDSDELFID